MTTRHPSEREAPATLDLVRWFGERLDEDERIAKAAPRGPWSEDGAGSIVDAIGGRVIPSVGGALDGRTTRWPESPAVDHILSQDPARMLHEIAAKRQILRALQSAEVALRNTEPGKDSHELMTGSTNSLRAAVRMLAAAYANRPGYREEWRP